MSVAALLRTRSVSRETLERLELYEALLRKWNPAINLVAKSTLADVWDRHVLDSAQLFDLADEGWKTWADLGSGGGFPGLVIAILAAQYNPDATVTLVESDQRKSAFLATVVRDTGLTAKILVDRIENIAPLNADIVSARALASLDVLLKYAKQHVATDGLALFPKGGNQQDEIAQAIEKWQFSYEQPKSITDADAVILAVRGVSRV